MKRIVSVSITHPRSILDALSGDGKSVVTAKYDDGSEGEALRYYGDELSFTPADFTGRTDEEVRALFHQRDVAYLRG